VAPPLKIVGLIALASLLALAGCGGDSFSLSSETDEPLYREGQQLEKQGRNREALDSYLRVIAKRGETAPESHLEAGLIYLEHVEDPIAAIYHFHKYLELEPNSRQAGQVRGLIDTAKLNFARTLPAKPLENPDTRLDGNEVVDQLRRENDELKAELAAYRSGAGAPPTVSLPSAETAQPAAPAAPAQESVESPPPAPAPAVRQEELPAAPITLAPLPQDGAEPQPPAPAPEPAAHSGRTHTVVRGDTLFSIAQRYYGTRSGAKVRGIVAANRDKLSSTSAHLKIGTVLTIP